MTEEIKLTEAQWGELARLRYLRIPMAWEQDGWDCFPKAALDMRVIKPLVRKGLVEERTHHDRRGWAETGYAITPAGHCALRNKEHG